MPTNLTAISQLSASSEFQDLENSRHHLNQIKTSLHETIAQLNQHPSLFSKGANFWGKTASWVKWLIGITLFCTLLGVGMIVHFQILIGLACLGALVYFCASLMLDNHYSAEKEKNVLLENTLNQSVNILGGMVSLLHELSRNLANEIQKLTQKIEELNQTSEQLAMTCAEFDQLKNHLVQMNQEHQTTLKDYKEQNVTFKNMLTILAIQLNGNEVSQQQFLNQFNQLLDDNATDITKLLTVLYGHQTELARVKHELDESNQTYQKLLIKHQRLLAQSSKQQHRVEKFLLTHARNNCMTRRHIPSRLFISTDCENENKDIKNDYLITSNQSKI